MRGFILFAVMLREVLQCVDPTRYGIDFVQLKPQEKIYEMNSGLSSYLASYWVRLPQLGELKCSLIHHRDEQSSF